MSEQRGNAHITFRNTSPYYISAPRTSSFAQQHHDSFSRKTYQIVPSTPKGQIYSQSPVNKQIISNAFSSFPIQNNSITIDNNSRTILRQTFSQANISINKHSRMNTIRPSLQKIKQTQRQMLSQLRNDSGEILGQYTKQDTPKNALIMQPNTHKIEEPNYLREYGTTKIENHSRQEELQQQKRRLQADMVIKTKRIEELVLNEKQLLRTIDNLKQQLQTKNQLEKDMEQIPILKQMVERLNNQVSHYKSEMERLIEENIRLKKQLVIRKIETEEKELKITTTMQDGVASMSMSSNDDATPSQNSLSSNHYLELTLKDTLIATLDKFKDNLSQLNTFKESQMDILRNSSNKYDYLHVEAEYQTTYFNMYTQAENLKHRLAIELKQTHAPNRDIESKENANKPNLADLLNNNAQLNKQLTQLRNYIEKQDIYKKQFLQQLEKANSINKLIFQQNEELIKQIHLLKRKGVNETNTLKHKSFASIIQTQINEKDQVTIRLRNQNEQLKEKIGILMVEINVLKNKGSQNHYSSDIQLKQKQEFITEFIREIQTLRLQCRTYKIEIQNYQTMINNLRNTISDLQQQLAIKDRYSSELQASLTPIIPKKPFILNKSLEDIEHELRQRLVSLTNQNSRLNRRVIELEKDLGNLMRQPYSNGGEGGTRELVLKQMVQQLQLKIGDIQKQFTNQRQSFDNTLSQKQQRIEQLQRQCAIAQTHRQEHLNNYQREMSRMLALSSQNQTRIRRELGQQLAQQQQRQDREKSEYMQVIRQLFQQKQKNEQDAVNRQRQLINKDIHNEKQISRLTADNESLKVSLQLQIERLSRANTEHSKTLIEKYQRDLLALTKANQTLLTQNKSVASTHIQNTNLITMVKQLQSQVKNNSTAVEHLWQIKKVQYDNIQKQLNQLRITISQNPNN